MSKHFTKNIYPLYSKEKVNKAAERIAESIRNGSDINPEDEAIIENWRASHTHVLDTWQKILSRRIKRKNIVFAQRLKRKNTIYDKLARYPKMKLARMHDIAGCRLIFRNMEDLLKFREELHNSKFNHFLKVDECKDYVSNPKESGYRGFHDVYVYKTKTTKDGFTKWDGLLVEIQYRTIYQHAWATAVEIADSLVSSRTKFSEGNPEQQELFKYASEIIAKAFEEKYSHKITINDLNLVKNFLKLEENVGIYKKLSQIKAIHRANILKKNAILIFNNKNPESPNVEVIQFKGLKEANNVYFKLEKEQPEKDIVLVTTSGKINSSIKSAYRNYFTDAKDFTLYMTDGMKIINGRIKQILDKLEEELNSSRQE